MKITFNEIEEFLVLYNKIKDEDFSFQTAYKLSKLNNIMTSEFKFFTNKFQDLINTYGIKNENGEYERGEDRNSIKIQEDKLDECNEKITELQQVEINIPEIEFELDEFKDIKIKPNELNGIIKFMKKETL